MLDCFTFINIVVLVPEVESLLRVIVEAFLGRLILGPLGLDPLEAAVDILEEDRNQVVTVGILEVGPFPEVVHIAIEDKLVAVTFLVGVVGIPTEDSLKFIKDMVTEGHILVEVADILVVVNTLKFVRDMVTEEHSLVEEAEDILLEEHNHVIEVGIVADIEEEPMVVLHIHLEHCTILGYCRHLKREDVLEVGCDVLLFQLQLFL